MYVLIIFNCKNIEEKKTDLAYIYSCQPEKKKLHLGKLEILTSNQNIPSNFSPFLPDAGSEI